MARERTVKVGCCGLRLRREEYFRTFPVVEIQHTFYQPPRLETLERWRAEAPDDFEFTVKAWMLITHEARSPVYRRMKRPLDDEERAECGGFRDSPIVREAWQTTLASARALGARKILFQCPASLRPTSETLGAMRTFFTKIASGEGLEYLWEPRGPWPPELVREVCDDLDLVHVVDPFAARTVTPARPYYRIHGRRGLAYEDEELAAIEEVLAPTGTSYVMFNNVRMVRDAGRFMALLGLRPPAP